QGITVEDSPAIAAAVLYVHSVFFKYPCFVQWHYSFLLSLHTGAFFLLYLVGQFRFHILAYDVESLVIIVRACDTLIHLCGFICLAALTQKTGGPAEYGKDIPVLADELHFWLFRGL